MHASGRTLAPSVGLVAWKEAAQPWVDLALDAGYESIPEDRGVDVFLAVAAVMGDRDAWSALTERYFARVRAALRRTGVAADAHEDVLQQLRTRLFVAPPGQSARVLRYVGHGDLGGLLKVTAVRLGLNAVRGPRRVADDEPITTLADGLDVELGQIERRYATEFKAAFEQAAAALQPEERNLLRLHIVDGLSIDRIAAIFRIHRSTAARRLGRARSRVSIGVRELLAAQLGEDVALPSLLRIVRSRLELSLSRVLGEEDSER